MMDLLLKWWVAFEARRQTGQGLVEYALILVLIAIVSIVIMRTLGTSIQSVFSNVQGSLVNGS